MSKIFIVSNYIEILFYMPYQGFLNFGMAGDRLFFPIFMVEIDIMFRAMTGKDAPRSFQLTDEFLPFHREIS